MRFKSYLLITILGTLAIPFVALVAWHYQETQKELETLELVREDMAKLMVFKIKNDIVNASRVIEMVGEFAASQEPIDTSRIQLFLDSVRNNNPEFLNIHIDNAEGRSIAFSPKFNEHDQSNVNKDHRDRFHWKVLRTGKHGVTGVVKGKGASEDFLVNVLAKPRNTGSGKTIFAVGALDLHQLAKQTLSSVKDENYVVWVFDRAGQLLFASDRKIGDVAKISSPPNTVNSGKRVLFSSVEGKDLIGYVHPIEGSDWNLAILSPTKELIEAKRSIISFNLLSFLGILLISLLAAELFSVPLSKSVEKLVAQVSSKRPKPNREEIIHSPLELKRLQKAFSLVFSDLENTQNQLKALNKNLQEEVQKQLFNLDAQAQTMDSVLSSMNDAVLMLDESGAVVFANSSARSLFGQNVDRCEFISLVQALFLSEFSPTVWLSGQPIRLTKKEGRKPFDMTVFPLTQQSKKLGVVLHDISNQESINRLKDDLIGMVAHELKTPLSSLKLQSDLLKLLASKGLSKDQAEEISNELSEEIDRLKELVNSWLDVAKLDAGVFELNLTIVQLKSIINKAINSVQGFGNFAIECEIDEDAECLRADPRALQQLFVNLLSNAIRYAKPDVLPRIFIRASIEGNDIVISVKDNGVGIKPEHQSKVFDRFYQIEMGAKRKPGGTGLGLVISMGIVRLHGGTLKLESIFGQGTTFIIRLPH